MDKQVEALFKEEHLWLRQLLYQILRDQEKQMAALDDLQAAVAKLQADVQAFIAAHPAGGASDAQLQAVTASVNAVDALVNPPAPPAP